MEKRIILATGHKHAFHRVSTLLAIQEGYFDDEGLPEVELIATGEDTRTMEALKSGDIHFGMDVKPGMILEANSNSDPVYILGAMINGLPSTFISTPDVTSVAGLKGKKLCAKEQGGGRDVPWMRMVLRAGGIDPDKDVSWVILPKFGSLEFMKPHLDRGDFQAVTLSGHYNKTELYDRVREAGFNVLAECTETHPYGLPSRVIACTDHILSHYPDEIVKVLKGVIRGYRFARDKKNVQRVREKYLSFDWGKEGFGWGKFDEELLEGQIASAQYLPPDGAVSEKGLEDLAREYKAWGKLPQNYSWQQAARFDFMAQAAKEVDSEFGIPEGYCR